MSEIFAVLVTSIEETGAASVRTMVESLKGSPSPSESVGKPSSEISNTSLKLPGLLPTALAVFISEPVSAASCVITYSAVKTMVSPTSIVCGCQ